jgi:hypothetical protein
MFQLRNALISLLAAVLAAGAQSHKGADELLDRVKGLPPEFAARLILDVEVIVSKLPPKERIALYEEAFRMAAHAELATPLQGTGFHTDTEPGFRQMASETGLDSLSLQYNAMLRIRRLDPARLQRMFREMRPLELQPQSCQDILRPELSKWAGAITLLYHTGFTAAERAKEEDIVFVEDQVRAVRSPLQLEQFSQIVSQADRRLLPRLSAAFDSALAQVRGDWFSYEYASSRIPLGTSNAAAFREYVVSHLHGMRCGSRGSAGKAEEAEAVARFNRFAADHEDLNLRAIDAAALEPSRVEERAAPEEFWKSEKSKRLLEELRWLTHGNRKLPDSQRFWTLDERRSMEWNERYLEFLKRVDNWRAADEPSPVAYFFMRSRVWLSLAKLVPPGPQRTNAFRGAISWLNNSYADGVVKRAEWWLFAKELLDAAKKEDLLDDVEQFGNPILSMYAHVDNRRSTMKPGGWAHEQ